MQISNETNTASTSKKCKFRSRSISKRNNDDNNDDGDDDQSIVLLTEWQHIWKCARMCLYLMHVCLSLYTGWIVNCTENFRFVKFFIQKKIQRSGSESTKCIIFSFVFFLRKIKREPNHIFCIYNNEKTYWVRSMAAMQAWNVYLYFQWLCWCKKHYSHNGF